MNWQSNKPMQGMHFSRCVATPNATMIRSDRIVWTVLLTIYIELKNY